MENLDLTLGKFFLEKYSGCLLRNRQEEEIEEGSMMEMVPPLKREMCGNQLRFLFKEEVTLEEIEKTLKEYYKVVGFRYTFYVAHGKIRRRIIGDIWFSGTHLTIQAGFERENNKIFSLSYSSVIS